MGDRARATYGFNRAREIVMSADPNKYSDDDYGSLLRDLAGTTALAAESNEAQLIPALMTKWRFRQHGPERDDDAGKGMDVTRGL